MGQMAVGNNPGERERRRWAAQQLTGKRYQADTPPEQIHLDMRANPRITLGNLIRSTEAFKQHSGCAECAEILTHPDAGMTQAQWDEFTEHHEGG